MKRNSILVSIALVFAISILAYTLVLAYQSQSVTSSQTQQAGSIQTISPSTVTSNQNQNQCRDYGLTMVTDQYSNGQLFSTWYNCLNSSITFNIAGSINGSSGSGYYNEGGVVSALGITVTPHTTINTVASVSPQYYGEQVNSLTFYAVNSSSTAVVLSSTYTLNV